MTKRTLAVSTAALAAVTLVAAAGVARVHADEPRVHVERHPHDADASAGWLGVSVEEAVDLAQGGALVRSVVPASPADEAGLEAGDVIVAVDGRAVRGPASLTQRIRDMQGGDQVTLTVVRDGRERTVEATLGDIGERVDEHLRGQLDHLRHSLEGLGEGLEGLEGLADIRIEGLEGLEGLAGLAQLEQLEGLEALGDMDFDFDFEHLTDIVTHFDHAGEHSGRVFVRRCEDGDCRSFTVHGDRPQLGVGLSDTTPELRRHLGGNDDAGALVDRVIDDSPAAAAGIRVGDLIVAIDGEPVKDGWEIRGALEGRDGERVRVEVVRGGTPLTIDVRLDASEDEREDDEPAAGARGPRT